MASYKKLGKNVVLLTIGNFASKVLTFLLVPFYTAILTTAEYGTADLITTTVNLILPFFTILVYESVMRFSLDNGCDRSQVFSIGFYITLIGCLVLVGCSPLLLLIDKLKDYIVLFVLYYVTMSFYNLVLQFTKGIEKVHIYSLAGIINTIIYLLCNIIFLLLLDMRIEGYLLAAIIGHSVSAVFAFLAVKGYRYILPVNRLNKVQRKEMLRYSLPMVPNAVSWWVSNSSDKYILTFFWGVAASGVYSVAYKIPSILTIFVSIFISAWQISAVEDFGSEESKNFYEDTYSKYELMIYLIASCLIAITKPLSRILFAKEFFVAWKYVPILIYAFIFNSLASFLGSIYTSAKKTKMLFYSTIIGAVFNIVFNIILIPIIREFGAAIATAASYIVVWLIRIIGSNKFFPIKVNWIRSLFANLILIGAIVCISIDFNPYYICSILIIVIMTFICRSIIKDIFKVLLKVKNKK